MIGGLGMTLHLATRLLATLLLSACESTTWPGPQPAPANPARSTPAPGSPQSIELDALWIVAPDRSSARATDAGVYTDAGVPDAATRAVPVQNADAVLRQGLFPRARACYNAGLKEDPDQHGRIVVTLQIGPAGDVLDSRIASNTGLSAKTASCIAGGARDLTFSPPDGTGSSVSVPMNFVKSLGGVRDAADAVVRDAVIQKASACYADALPLDPATEGASTYFVSVDSTGAVASVSADPDPRLPRALLGCVADALKAATFPGSIAFHILIRFHPTSDIHRPRP
jgi:hypothetical protein